MPFGEISLFCTKFLRFFFHYKTLSTLYVSLQINEEIISYADDIVILVEANDWKTANLKAEEAINIFKNYLMKTHSHFPKQNT